jgi:predicted nucleic acid-binding protein
MTREQEIERLARLIGAELDIWPATENDREFTARIAENAINAGYRLVGPEQMVVRAIALEAIARGRLEAARDSGIAAGLIPRTSPGWTWDDCPASWKEAELAAAKCDLEAALSASEKANG